MSNGLKDRPNKAPFSTPDADEGMEERARMDREGTDGSATRGEELKRQINEVDRKARQGEPLAREDFYPSAHYLLEPDFEQLSEHDREIIDRFFLIINNIITLANIRRSDIGRFLNYFDLQWIWIIEEGVRPPPRLYPQLRFIFEMQLTRSVEALERKLQTQSPVAEGERGREEEKKSLLSRLFE